ncbi:MFS transporter [Pantoea sp.]|uniref:MFS transporter n=1 Tax=Pantoea sp. TaxID=69393 RepID=UPI002898FCB4|nr:MFS transporter [Pantoea sp.]
MLLSHFRRPEIRLFFVVSVLFYMSIQSIDAFLAPIMVGQSIEPQMIMGTSGLATLFIRFPLGVISDVVKSRKKIIQISLLLPLITWPLAYLEPNAATLWLAKAADGFTAATWVLYNVLFIRYFRSDEAPAAVALLALAGPVGVFIGNTIAGLLIHYFAGNASYFLSSTAALLALLLTTRIKEESTRLQAPSLQASIAEARCQLVDSSIWLIGFLAIIVVLVPFATRDTLTPIYAKQLGAQSGILAMLSNLHLVCYAAGMAFCSSAVGKSTGLLKTAIVGMLLQAISSAAIPCTQNMAAIFFLQAVSGFSFGMAFATLISLSVLNTGENEQSARTGLFQTIYSCGMFAGPVIIGIVMQYGSLRFGYFITGAFSLGAILLTPLALRLVYQRQRKLLSTDLPATPCIRILPGDREEQ